MGMKRRRNKYSWIICFGALAPLDYCEGGFAFSLYSGNL
jgi:hypothetical protein